MNNDRIISDLNKLITRNYDAEYGFKQASDRANNPELKHLFNTFADWHNEFGHELKAEIQNMNGEISKGTSAAADAHRTWIDIKSNVKGNTDEAVLEECVRGEKKALEDYKNIVSNQELPVTTQRIIDEQMAKIEEFVISTEELAHQY